MYALRLDGGFDGAVNKLNTAIGKMVVKMAKGEE